MRIIFLKHLQTQTSLLKNLIYVILSINFFNSILHFVHQIVIVIIVLLLALSFHYSYH